MPLDLQRFIKMPDTQHISKIQINLLNIISKPYTKVIKIYI